jgi:hypothetical protein
MRPPDATRPVSAVAENRPQECDRLGGAISPSTKPRSPEKQELLDRLDVIEVLSHWKLELQAKLARKKLVFMYVDSDTDFGPLADEVRDFVRVSKMLKWLRRSRP